MVKAIRNGNDEVEVYCLWYRCSGCGFVDIAENYKYCPRCGKKIEW